MVKRQIDLDALTDLLRTHQSAEIFLEECEEAQQDSLLAQKKRAGRGFRDGSFTTWDEVKRRNGL
jgi:broad specificity phosphatase PhoE